MIARILGTALALCLATAPAFAEALPRPGRTDSRVRDVSYNKDNVTAIDASGVAASSSPTARNWSDPA